MIPLGPGPVPRTSSELDERLAAGLGRMLTAAHARLVTVESRVGADAAVEHVRIDVTGVDASAARDIDPGAVTSSVAAIVGALSVVGSPAVVRGLPVQLTAEAQNVPVTWNESADGPLWLSVEDSADAARPASARVDASTGVEDIERLVSNELGARLGGMGLALKGLSVDVQAVGARGLDLRSDATVGKSFLSAKVTVTARATVDDALTLTISNVDLTSGNPIVSALVSRADAMLAPWNGRRIDLTRYSFAGARLRDVEVSADDRIRVHAAFGA